MKLALNGAFLWRLRPVVDFPFPDAAKREGDPSAGGGSLPKGLILIRFAEVRR